MASGIGHNIAVRHSESQETAPMLTTPINSKAQIARFAHTDKIVGRLGEFPELTKAVREGDVETVSILCRQLFDLNSDVNIRPNPTPVAP
jgi:hypothetical protein